jgi:serine/threonine-protein kinase
MPFVVPITDAQRLFPEYKFVRALTPSEEKAAFQAKDPSTDADLCVKIINPLTPVERVGRELQALAALNHKNLSSLVAYHNTITKDGHRHATVEPFIDGVDLAAWITPGRNWRLKEASEFFSQILDGLDVLCGLGLVHRDLKPTNIRIHTDGHPVIIDFGLARHLLLDPLTKTHQGARLGSQPYFSPEQWRGTYKDIDHRTDLFAFGVILFEATTGRHPFWTQKVMTVLELEQNACERDLHWLFPEFLQLPGPWQTLLKRLLERDKARRPISANIAASVLRKIGGAV